MDNPSTWLGTTSRIYYADDMCIISSDRDSGTVQVPFEDIKNFILQYLRDMSVANLQAMSNADLESYFTDGFPKNDSAIFLDGIH